MSSLTLETESPVAKRSQEMLVEYLEYTYRECIRHGILTVETAYPYRTVVPELNLLIQAGSHGESVVLQPRHEVFNKTILLIHHLQHISTSSPAFVILGKTEQYLRKKDATIDLYRAMAYCDVEL